MTRQVFAWDTETALIRPGKHAPELSCLSYQTPGSAAGLLAGADAVVFFRTLLAQDTLLVGHNVAYDCGVMGAADPAMVPAIFDAYDADRITCTMLREKLLDIAGGTYRGKFGADDEWIKISYHLSDLYRKYTGQYMVKDGWRMYYGEFIGVPMSHWMEHAVAVQAKYRPDFLRLQAEQQADPKGFNKKQLLADLRELCTSPPEGCATYPLHDAEGTLIAYQGQEQHVSYLDDQYRAARKDFWLHLMSTWGLRTSHEGVARLKQEAEALYEETKAYLIPSGLVRANGTKDTKAAKERMESVCLGAGLRLRRTKGTESNPDGGIALDEDACKATDDAILHAYSRYAKLAKVLSNDVQALSQGVTFPVHTHFGMAETGRTTSAGPNVQNFGRKGGARECFRPREGFVYAACDVDQLELRTLAQACITLLGASELGATINRGIDPHTLLGSQLMGITYEQGMAFKTAGPGSSPDADRFDDCRQTAKVANFGLPGGLGAAKLVLFARKTYNVDLGKGQGEEAAVAYAKALKAAWLRQWPEMVEYFRHINSLKSEHGEYYNLVQLFSNRHRGGARYTSACNSFFQGLGADATGRGGWYVSRACYAEPSSPLYGCRPVNYVHDDLLCEVPRLGGEHEAAEELARLFVKGINEFLPDVPATAGPLLTTRMSKKAKRLTGPDGRIMVWEPKEEKTA